MEGKNANNPKGSANPEENPSIAQKAPDVLPDVDAATSAFPTIGPVQEKETTTNANAIKKMPTNPPLSPCASILFTNEDGNTISNAPKKDAAKTNNNIKITKLNPALVANVFSAPPPQMAEMPSPNVTKITIIDKAYKTAFSFPFAFVLLLLRKKLTFIGINGNTQGVKSAAKPHKNPVNRIDHQALPSKVVSSGSEKEVLFEEGDSEVGLTIFISSFLAATSFFELNAFTTALESIMQSVAVVFVSPMINFASCFSHAGLPFNLNSNGVAGGKIHFSSVHA